MNDMHEKELSDTWMENKTRKNWPSSVTTNYTPAYKPVNKKMKNELYMLADKFIFVNKKVDWVSTNKNFLKSFVTSQNIFLSAKLQKEIVMACNKLWDF